MKCSNILNKTAKHKGDLHVCFYILFGDVVNVRFLTELSDDSFFKPPSQPVYDTVEVKLNDLEALQQLVTWSVCQLGKSYDIPRAVLLMTPFTLRLEEENPEKYFCSQMIMYLFRSQNLFDTTNININHMKPDDVWTWLNTQIKGTEEENENGIKEAKENTNE